MKKGNLNIMIIVLACLLVITLTFYFGIDKKKDVNMDSKDIYSKSKGEIVDGDSKIKILNNGKNTGNTLDIGHRQK